MGRGVRAGRASVWKCPLNTGQKDMPGHLWSWGLEFGGFQSHHQTNLTQETTPSGQGAGTWASSKPI